MDRPLVAVVMAGGTGTRLYPAARPDRPKQFLPLGGDRSLLERTVDRLAFADETLVVTSAAHEAGVRERAPDATVLVEPEPKDTGPALVYAAHRARALFDDPVLLCVPADHVVADREGPGGSFAGVGRAAARVAVERGGLVTVGVEPTRPATGYGYVEPGPWRDIEWPARSADGPDDSPPALPERYAPVASFHEKPDAATAEEYVAAGRLWNAGLFAWTPGALLSAAADSPLAPLVETLEDGGAAMAADGAAESDAAAGYAAVDPTSVDYAVMERAEDAWVVPAGFAWDDLGTWDAVWRALGGETAADGTVTLGDGLALDAPGTLVATDGPHVGVAGVEDVVVAAFDDRVVVVPREEAGRVRDLVAALREEGRYQ